MLSRIFGRWEPFEAKDLYGTAGDVAIAIKSLRCERNLKSGKVRLEGDFGVFFVDWLESLWKQEGGSPLRMHSSSPWNLVATVDGFPPFPIVIEYKEASTEHQMFSDTLDALIDALEKQAEQGAAANP